MMILKAYFVKFKIFKNKSMIINTKMIMKTIFIIYSHRRKKT